MSFLLTHSTLLHLHLHLLPFDHRLKSLSQIPISSHSLLENLTMSSSTPRPSSSSSSSKLNQSRIESNFRSNLTGFKWARGLDQQHHDPTKNSSSSSSITTNNPFYHRFTSSISGYVPLRSNERTNEEEAYYALSSWERTIGFLICTAGATICFMISFFTLPLLAIKPRKFAVSFSLGSILFMFGFIVLQGPLQHLKHIFSLERLPFTISYLISLSSTLYFAIGLHSYLGTLITGLIQVAVLIIYLVTYFVRPHPPPSLFVHHPLSSLSIRLPSVPCCLP